MSLPDIIWRPAGGLPKTRSAKIVRGAIRKIYLGEEISHMDLSSLDSPEHLQSIREAV